jgi:hypothetical protein
MAMCYYILRTIARVRSMLLNLFLLLRGSKFTLTMKRFIVIHTLWRKPLKDTLKKLKIRTSNEEGSERAMLQIWSSASCTRPIMQLEHALKYTIKSCTGFYIL